MTTEISFSAPTAAPRRPLWQRLLGMHLGSQLVIAAWLLGTAVVSIVVILAITSRFVEPSLSAVSIAGSVALWFPLGVAIVLVVSSLRTVVAAGGTRRAFATAGLVAAPVLGLVYAVAYTGLLLLEELAYDRLGWVQSAQGAPGAPAALSHGILPVFVGTVLAVSISAVCGLLVGVSYLRWRGWATLALPLTVVLPFLVISVATRGPGAIGISTETGPAAVERLQAAPLGVVLALLTLAAVAAAFWWLVRRTPIRPAQG